VLAQQVRHQQPARAFALPYAVAGEQAQQLMFLITAVAELILTLSFGIVLVSFASLTQQVPEQHAPGAAAMEHAAADQQAHEPMLSVIALAVELLLALALVLFL
jgi:hypothetical protein